ncbi:hypothetical protein MMC16_002872 [Acarospora aff. strigata]|nr:hypothetical protein [Acarospora aff. strigata]
MWDILGNVSNSTLVGKDIGMDFLNLYNGNDEELTEAIVRNEDHLYNARKFTIDLVISVMILKHLPEFMKPGFVSGLREEIENFVRKKTGDWTKGDVRQLDRIDSAIKESMRLEPLMAKVMERKVVSKHGITLKDGLKLPQGAIVVSSAYSVHRDESIYPCAHEYDAFRFSRPQKKTASHKSVTSVPTMSDDHTHATSPEVVSTSEKFLAFGHGRHACPGRFFAAHQLELLLADVLLNYDIKHITQRPPNEYHDKLAMPSMKATIQMRRRTPS